VRIDNAAAVRPAARTRRTGWRRADWRRGIGVGAATLAACVTLAGCGGSGGSDANAAPAPAASTPTAAPSGRPSMDRGQMDQITNCLKAAGIAVPTPTGSRPTGSPATPRQGGGQNGGMGSMFNSPEARAALQACGIALPTRSPGATPPGAP
jgi:hypothetical protein